MFYNHMQIEKKWQERWEKEDAFATSTFDTCYYVLEMFPYPSGDIHMGHVRNYTIGDVLARYKRMQGHNVFHPIGWDAFGLPAENAAIQRGVHPHTWTLNNIAAMRKQLQALGISYDWSTEITTCSPEYYAWEQLFFIRFFEKGLIYRKNAPQNWCPQCNTVLANEQVRDNCCWRCNTPIEQKELAQWFFRMTHYAEKLLENLSTLQGWPDNVKEMQRNWIGKSEGAYIRFPVQNQDLFPHPSAHSINAFETFTGEAITVFTTRPDTLFGVSAIVLAPEHPFVQALLAQNLLKEQRTYIETLQNTATFERSATTKKEGVFTGYYALHPYTEERIPIWIANFVLPDYGTGALMCVPAHDERDYAFAMQYDITIRTVICQDSKNTPSLPYTEEGILCNSGHFSNMHSTEARNTIVDELSTKGMAKRVIHYKLRDWNISRQRYWGTPIPMVYCDNCGIVAEKEQSLPVLLPTDCMVRTDGQSVLAHTPSFYETTCPKCAGPARRETDTLDTFFESSWYFLRYLDSTNTTVPINQQRAKACIPVTQYIGGIEHAVMHLLYARCFTMALHDIGFLQDSVEPFANLLTQGMVLKNGAKMSKSKGNTVDPNALIAEYGADAVRLFCLFAAPPERDFDWVDSGIEGTYRFLNRVFTLYTQLQDILTPVHAASSVPDVARCEQARSLVKKEHETIKKYTENIENFRLNTAIANLMELVNATYKSLEELDHHDNATVYSSVMATILTLLAPYAPHLAEELWEATGHTTPLYATPLPKYNADLLVESFYTIAVQINGKLRATCQVPIDATEQDVLAIATCNENVRKYITDKKIHKTIFVPKKLINFVIP